MDAILEKFAIEKAGPGTWDTTADTYRYRIRMPSDFDTSTFRTVKLNKTGKTIKSVMGKLKGEDKMTMQNVMFPKDEWTKEEAEKWVDSHKDSWK
jgi:hypothetical protein